MKSREWLVKMQKDIIKQVNKNSELHGSHPKMVDRMKDFQQVCKEGMNRPDSPVR